MQDKQAQDTQAMDAFRSAPVPKAVLRNAVPAMIAMLMTLIYNLADTFFIGQTHQDILVAAVSLATPVFLLFMSVGTIFGMGGTSVIARAMGEGRPEYAKKVSSFCMWACVAVGVAMSAAFLLWMNQLLGLVGASEDIWAPAKTYLTIVSLCGPFVLVSTCYANVIRAEGQSTRAMAGQLIGNLLNIILDPVMILAFDWGIAGAAVATVIGNVAGAAYYIVYFLRGRSALSIHPRDFTVREGVCKNVLAIGIPAALGNLLMSVSQIIVNTLMTGYNDMALAGIGVAMKVTMMTGMVCIGLGQGVQALLGYCVGARLWARFKASMRFSLGFAFGLSAVLTGLCVLFTGPIVSVFLTTPDAYDYAFRFARILLSTSIFFGVYYVLANSLQAMGAATEALVINLSRQGLIYIPMLFILRALMGIDGLAWAQPVADLLSLALVTVIYARTFRKLSRNAEAALPDAAADGKTIHGAKIIDWPAAKGYDKESGGARRRPRPVRGRQALRQPPLGQAEVFMKRVAYWAAALASVAALSALAEPQAANPACDEPGIVCDAHSVPGTGEPDDGKPGESARTPITGASGSYAEGEVADMIQIWMDSLELFEA